MTCVPRLFATCALLLCLGCPRVGTVGVVDDMPSVVPPDEGRRDAGQTDGSLAQPERVVIDECQPDAGQGLDAATIAALTQANSPAPNMRMLYPYPGTVFPRGLSAPVLMWDGPPADAVYVHLHSDALDYRGCLRPDGPGQLTLPNTGWLAAQQTAATRAAELVLELTSVSAGQTSGPLRQELTIAPGALGGSVLYMTYNSKVAFPATTAVMRVRPGGSAEPFIASLSCAGCHSASADGLVFTAFNNGSGMPFRRTPAGGVESPPLLPGLQTGMELAALVPDGSLYVAPAHPSGLGPRAYSLSSQQSELYETFTGMPVADSGITRSAVTPSFSADGSLLTFVDASIAGGRSLAMMRFSLTQRKASDQRLLYTDEQRFPGWPSFLPDRTAIVFALGERSDLSGNGAGLTAGPTHGPASDLYAVSTAANNVSNAAGMLFRAMGFDTAEDVTSENTYLPFGAEDLHQNYNPSLSTVRAGGYDWVLFDSMRHYGNQGVARQIWVAALDAPRDGKVDPGASHPAFYLSGQEFSAGNVRAVFARDAR